MINPAKEHHPTIIRDSQTGIYIFRHLFFERTVSNLTNFLGQSRMRFPEVNKTLHSSCCVAEANVATIATRLNCYIPSV